jgi:hypothetical protein
MEIIFNKKFSFVSVVGKPPPGPSKDGRGKRLYGRLLHFVRNDGVQRIRFPQGESIEFYLQNHAAEKKTGGIFVSFIFN